jgi:hypothetical protein
MAMPIDNLANASIHLNVTIDNQVSTNTALAKAIQEI